MLDGENRIKELNDMFSKLGMHPGNALYRHLGMLFYKYLGNPDVTFQQLCAPLARTLEPPVRPLAPSARCIQRADVECMDASYSYDLYGVELAVAVTNVSRASVELLHVKTAPNYPIRKVSP